MLDILDILDILHLQNNYTDEEIMKIAGIKGKDTYAKWWQGTKPSGKAFGKLLIEARKLLPVEFVCPHGVPTREMYLTAIQSYLTDIRRRYPSIDGTNGRHFDWMKKEHPDFLKSDYVLYKRYSQNERHLLKHKHFYELGWTDKKQWHQPHYGIRQEDKIATVAFCHPDENIRKHFAEILRNDEQV